MKIVMILFCLLVLLSLAVPVSADTSSISSVSPRVAYKGSLNTFTIAGDFNTSSVTVKLMKSGVDDNITAAISSLSTSQIVCTFSSSKVSSIDTGTRKLVVVNNDGSEVTYSADITIRPEIKQTSITPTKARTNSDDVEVSLVGSGLEDIVAMYLHSDDYGNVSATDVDPLSSTKVNGTFDMDGKSLDTYDVCIKDDFGTILCDLTFEITTDAVGSIDIASSPSGASVYLDGTLKGTTPLTLEDLDVGSYKLILKKDGYDSWSRTAKVTDGSTLSYDADLDPVTTVTTATPVWTSPPTTVRTTAKSTLQMPTSWPSDTPTTEASPVETAVIIGGIAIAFLALRRR